MFVIAFSTGLFFQFCSCAWGVVLWLWGVLVASHGSFGRPVAFWGFIELSLSWSMGGGFWFECLETIMFFFKESSNPSPKRWESMSSANLARSLYSQLTPDNRNFFPIDTKFWLACPDILMPSRIEWMTSNFSSLWSPFVFKMLGSRESNL